MKHFSMIKSIALVSTVAMTAFTVVPAHADDDTVTLRIGVIQVNGDTQLKGAVTENDNVSYLSKRFDFGDRTVPRVEGIYHFSTRQRILFNYFRYERDNHFTLDRDINVDGTMLPAGDPATATAEMGLGNLVYDYALTETPTTSFGLQFGVAWADIDGRVKAVAGPVLLGTRQSESGFAPVLGARFSGNTPDQHWGFSLQGQYVNTSWGNFDTYNGSITRINGLIEYRFTPNFGLYGGYDWFRLNVDHDFGKLNGGVDLRFMGPTAGATFAF